MTAGTSRPDSPTTRTAQNAHDRARTPSEPAAEDLDAFLDDLLRIMANVASGDFSEKPPLLDGDDPIARFMVGFRFIIDDLESAHRQREAEVERLRELDAMKTHLVNLVAHELNTPITPMRLQLHMLRKRLEDSEDASDHRAIKILDRNLDRLQRLIRDTLDVARFEAGHFDIARKECTLDTVLRHTVADQRPVVETAGIDLVVHIEPSAPVRADPDRIAQVVGNLLTNATKFSHEGGTIEVGGTHRPDGYTVTVKDDGRGIEARDIPRLFSPFVQVHEPAETGIQGTGLGLYICKAIVEAHGGTITCRSPGRGRGTTFRFTIPYDDGSRTEAE